MLFPVFPEIVAEERSMQLNSHTGRQFSYKTHNHILHTKPCHAKSFHGTIIQPTLATQLV